MKEFYFFILLLLTLTSCGKNFQDENVTTIVNVSSFTKDHSQLVMSSTVSTCWITPNEGISSVVVRDPLTKRYTSSIVRRTINGGKSWDLCGEFKFVVKDIQHHNGVVYAYLNETFISAIRKEFIHGVNEPSRIIKSLDWGKSWQTLYEFSHNISNFMVFDSLTMVAVSEINLASKVENSYMNSNLIISRDGGVSWEVIDKLSPISTSPSSVYRVGTKLYFRVAMVGEYKYLHSFDLITGEHNRRKVVGGNDILYSYGVVDDLLIQPLDGICTYKMRDDSLEFISNYTWGWRAGAFHIKYIAKDGRYIFVYSSRYPGNRGIDRALHVSFNNGDSWRKLAFGPKDVRLPHPAAWSTYANDTTFQVSAIIGDTTRIYRIKKTSTNTIYK